MLRVVHITPSYKPAYVYGGPTISVSQLCEAECATGLDILVLTTTAHGKVELTTVANKIQYVEGVKVIYFRRWTKDHTHFSPHLLYYVAFKLQKNTIIHIHSWWNLVVIPSVIICLLRGIRPILSPRGMLSSFSLTTHKSFLKKIFQTLLGDYLLSNCIIHFTTNYEKNTSKLRFKKEKYFVTPNIVELPMHLHEESYGKKEFDDCINFIFVSRINPVKNLEMVFDALSCVTFNWRLNIYGTGEDAYIDKLKKKTVLLSINKSISWNGWLDGDIKYKTISTSDVLILTSFTENFANVIIESLSVGTPVLISKNVGLCDYVTTKKLGWVADLTTESIIQNLEDIYNNQMKLPLMRAAAIKHIRKDFDTTCLAQEYIKAYKHFSDK